MAKKKKELLQIGIVIAIVIGAYLYFNQSASGDNFLTITYYRNGVPVQVQFPQSVIGGTPGITDITVTATITNTGQIPLTCKFSDGTPNPLKIAMPTTILNVPVSGSASITTTKIPIAQFEGTSPSFWAKVGCDYTYAGTTKSLYKEGTLNLGPITADLMASFNVGFTTWTGGSSGGSGGTCNVAGTSCSLIYAQSTASDSTCCSGTCNKVSQTGTNYNSHDICSAGGNLAGGNWQFNKAMCPTGTYCQIYYASGGGLQVQYTDDFNTVGCWPGACNVGTTCPNNDWVLYHVISQCS